MKLSLLKFIGMNYSFLRENNIKPIDNDFIFLFDIDDTLYKASKNMKKAELEAFELAYNTFKHKNKNAPNFARFYAESHICVERFHFYFNISPIEAEQARKFDFKKFIKKDKNLKNCLDKIPYRKWCFTNGTRARAETILAELGLLNSFEGVICLDGELSDESCLGKPYDNAYKFVEELLKINDPKKVYFYDDSSNNIAAGLKRGWNSTLIGQDDNLVLILENDLENILNDIDR